MIFMKDKYIFLRVVIAVKKDEFRILWLLLPLQNALIYFSKKLQQHRKSHKSELSETLKGFW